MSGVGRFARLLTGAAAHPRVALLGAREFRGCGGVTYDGDTESPRSVAYDCSRELAHLATGRYWDDCAPRHILSAWERRRTRNRRNRG